MIAGKEALCVNLRFRMRTLLKLLFNRRLSDLKNPDMTIVFMEFLWCALESAVIRWQSCLAIAREPSSIGCIALKNKDSLDCMIPNVQGDQLNLTRSSDRPWGQICVSLHAISDMLKAFGMEDFSVIIFLRYTG